MCRCQGRKRKSDSLLSCLSRFARTRDGYRSQTLAQWWTQKKAGKQMFTPRKIISYIFFYIWPIPKYKYPTVSQLTLPCMCHSPPHLVTVGSVLTTSLRARAPSLLGEGVTCRALQGHGDLGTVGLCDPNGLQLATAWPWLHTLLQCQGQGGPEDSYGTWSWSHQSINQSWGIIIFSSKRVSYWLWKKPTSYHWSLFSPFKLPFCGRANYVVW